MRGQCVEFWYTAPLFRDSPSFCCSLLFALLLNSSLLQKNAAIHKDEDDPPTIESLVLNFEQG